MKQNDETKLLLKKISSRINDFAMKNINENNTDKTRYFSTIDNHRITIYRYSLRHLKKNGKCMEIDEGYASAELFVNIDGKDIDGIIIKSNRKEIPLEVYYPLYENNIGFIVEHILACMKNFENIYQVKLKKLEEENKKKTSN